MHSAANAVATRKMIDRLPVVIRSKRPNWSWKYSTEKSPRIEIRLEIEFEVSFVPTRSIYPIKKFRIGQTVRAIQRVRN